MKKKLSALIVSFALIAVCVSLIAGATFALFTSDSGVDITISSAKVQIHSTVENIVSNLAYGSAEFNASTKSLDIAQMVPGDEISFDIVVKNSSSIETKYRTVISSLEDTGLFDGLKVTIDGVVADGFTKVSAWTTTPAVTEETVVARINVVIEFPDNDNNNAFQDASCKIACKVEAVQGNATTSDPVVGAVNVSSPADFAKVSALAAAGRSFAGETIVLNSDVDLTNVDWAPIGTAENPFRGAIQGNGHTISGLSESLIGYATDSISVSDLTLDVDVNFAGDSGRKYAGAVVNSYNLSSEGDYTIAISDVTVEGSVAAYQYVAAIIGSVCHDSGVDAGLTTTISNCTNNATVVGASNKARAGGIVGYYLGWLAGDKAEGIVRTKANKLVLENCTNNGDVSATESSYQVGGIVAWLQGPVNVEFTHCVNNGTLSGKAGAGDLLGRNHYGGAIYTTSGTSNNSAHPFGHLDFDPVTLHNFDFYFGSEKKVILRWEFNKSNANEGLYWAATPIANGVHRCVIDGVAVRFAHNTSINGISDCMVDYEDHAAHVNVLPVDEITGASHWNDDRYDYLGLTVASGAYKYTWKTTQTEW